MKNNTAENVNTSSMKIYMVMDIAKHSMRGRICGQLCKNLENEHKISNDMKNKILDLVKSTVWLILCLIVFSLAFEGIYSLVNRNEPAKEFGTTVFSKRGHDYLLIDTRHGVCVIHAKSYPCNNKKIPKQ